MTVSFHIPPNNEWEFLLFIFADNLYCQIFVFLHSTKCVVVSHWFHSLPFFFFLTSSAVLFFLCCCCFSFIFISWRQITFKYCSGFSHTLTWISHGFTCIPITTPPPTSLSTQFLWVFPVHQAPAFASCIQPALVICFTLDNMYV